MMFKFANNVWVHPFIEMWENLKIISEKYLKNKIKNTRTNGQVIESVVMTMSKLS